MSKVYRVDIKRGDTARTLTDTLTIDGTAIDLTGATVVLVWDDGTTITRKSANIVSAVAGTVSYVLTSADTLTAKTVRLEWEVTFPTAAVLTIPSDGYIVLNILADLG